MALMICIPLTTAKTIEVSGVLKGDILVDIREQGDFFEGEFADFAVNVKYYEPRPLTSSVIEKGNAPVFVHLMAIPTTPMGSMPRIQSINIMVLLLPMFLDTL